MKSAGLIRLGFVTMLAIVLLWPSISTAQDKCDRKGVILLDADVYRQVPKYITGSGWHGERVTTLRSNTQVYICGEQSEAFGFSTKTWMQIAYEGANRSWQYGWVLKDNLTILSTGSHAIKTKSKYALIADALADEPVKTDQATTEWKLGPPPAAPLLQIEEKSTSATMEPGSASLSDLGQLYWPLFVALLIGMIAKAVVDWLDASDKSLMRQHLRNGVISILVSPIVFLGFLSAGQFSTSTQTFVVLCLLAFQNGFFWQTVLKRKMREEQADAGANSASGAAQAKS